MSGGWAGVDLFFVLSGFLVSGLLFEEYGKTGRVDYRRFFWRRGLKIYPAFFTLVVLYGVFEYLVGTFTWKGLLGEVLFIQNYYASLWNHTWSLAVEEHFYLLIGLTVTWLAGRRRMHLIPSIALGILAGCLLFRCLERAVSGTLNDYATHLRMDSLMFGVLLSYFYHTNRAELEGFLKRVRPIVLPAAFISFITLVVFPFGHIYWQTVGYSMLYLAFGSLMLYALPMRANLVTRVLAFVGIHSYSVYLWHMFVKRVFSFLRKDGCLVLPWGLEFSAYVIGSIGLGILMAKLVEFPVLRFRDRFFPTLVHTPAEKT